MRAVVQRVTWARVRVDDAVVGEINRGLMVLLGVSGTDVTEDVRYVAEKIAHLRIFPDESGRMERSVLETGGGVLLVSQFTLYGDARKGRRPSFTEAAGGELARMRYEEVTDHLRSLGLTVATGSFGAHMLIDMTGDGPVTLLLDSRRQF